MILNDLKWLEVLKRGVILSSGEVDELVRSSELRARIAMINGMRFQLASTNDYNDFVYIDTKVFVWFSGDAYALCAQARRT